MPLGDIRTEMFAMFEDNAEGTVEQKRLKYINHRVRTFYLQCKDF